MSRRAAGPDQVPGDHRLAVSGREGVQRSPAERRGEQEEDQETVGVAARERVGEPVERPILAALAAREARRRRDRARSRPHLEARLAVVGRARQEVLRVASQGVRGIGGGDAGGDVGPAPREDLDRPPADPAGEGAVDQLDPARAAQASGAEKSASTRVRSSPPWPEGKLSLRDRAAGSSRSARPSAVSSRPEEISASSESSSGPRSAPSIVPFPLRVEALDLLEGRDLGLVEDVVDASLAARRSAPERAGWS